MLEDAWDRIVKHYLGTAHEQKIIPIGVALLDWNDPQVYYGRHDHSQRYVVQESARLGLMKALEEGVDAVSGTSLIMLDDKVIALVSIQGPHKPELMQQLADNHPADVAKWLQPNG